MSLPTSAMPTAAASSARLIAVTSGKGGVGKTFASANLAAALAARGERVLLLDADLGLANLDVVLNVAPRVTLHDVIAGRREIDEAIVEAPGGFSVLLAGSGLVEYSRLTPALQQRLIQIVDALRPRYDRVLLDTGAGISEVVLFTVAMADEVLLVATPEPTALTDAYATIKVLATTQRARRLMLLVNQVARAGDGRRVCAQLQQVVRRYVDPTVASPVTLELVGEVPDDASVRDAVLRRQLVAELYPGSPSAQGLLAAAARIAA